MILVSNITFEYYFWGWSSLKSKKGRKGEESRKRLLKAAANEFSIRGFHDTKISEIVKKLGSRSLHFTCTFKAKKPSLRS